MCGIAGMAGGPPPDPRTLERMAGAMAHRGPDAQGVWHDADCGLGFRRLAIIDLDARSDQPMHAGPLHLVYNGELYNYLELRCELARLGHRFVTEGDTEVLLRALVQWGEGALDRINAMFAFAAWDDERRTLTLAVDPFGEKPLYWRRDGRRILFASDVRALIEADSTIAPDREGVLAAYLAHGTLPEVDGSFFAGVQRLPAAHRLRWCDGRVDVRRYWAPAPVDVPNRYADAVGRLRELLLDAIRLRLRSDVPVGTSLSGGVDSSAIVALSAELAGDHRRHAFTARFPGFARDEWRYAQLGAHAAGVSEHHAVQPTADELLDDLPALIADQEEPFASLSIYAQWRVNRAAKEAGVVVLLDGQGADELLAGYPGLESLGAVSEGWPATVRAARGAPVATARALAGGHVPQRLRRWLRMLAAASPYVAPPVIARAASMPLPGEIWTAPHHGTPLRRELLRQTFASSLPALLRYADRDSMAHSREIRLPFLDRRVAEYALSLPATMLRHGGLSKVVLRDAVRDVVPPAILQRRDKVGFEPPQAAWLATPRMREHACDVLLDPGARIGALLDRDALETDVRAGTWRDDAAMWRALNAELWLTAFDPAPRSRPLAVR